MVGDPRDCRDAGDCGGAEGREQAEHERRPRRQLGHGDEPGVGRTGVQAEAGEPVGDARPLAHAGQVVPTVGEHDDAGRHPQAQEGQVHRVRVHLGRSSRGIPSAVP